VVRIRYTAWDGTQTVRLDPDRVFDALADLLSRTDDLRQALDWLLREGLDMDGVRVMGLDEALERLREAIRSRERDLNLDHALDEPRKRLDEILARERETLDEGIEGDADGTLAREKKALLDDLPADLAGAMERLARDYRFEDEEAERAFRELMESLDDVRSVEDFRRAEGDRFRGPRDLDFREAADLVREIAALRDLERRLASGDLPGLDMDVVRRMLGEDVARDLERLGQVMLLLQGAGYLREREGRVELSARGVRRIGALALRDIYDALVRDRPGGHPSGARGPGEPRHDRTRRWEQGDALDVALVPTLLKALTRWGGTPVSIEPRDFEVRETDQAATTSTVLLLDMSWSMSWEGRFAAAKKVALALESLVRTRFPRDYFGIVGFYTRAVELRARDLPEATWNVGDPFTNLQDGLRLAGRMLAKHPSRNQHVIVVTDGQPTAYFHRGRLHCEWPLSYGGVSLRASAETLREVERVTRRGITINTFMLDDSPGLRAFVERMTRINRGRALYSRPDRLGEYLLVDYLGRKRKRI